MNRLFRHFVPLALVALVISGCSSMPTKSDSDESLVVIKTVFVNPDNLPRGYELKFNYSRNYPNSWIGQYSWDFNVVVIREPGVELESIGTQVQANFRGETPEYAVHAPLPYEPGRIAIADFVFVHEIRKTAERTQTSSFSLRQITDQEKDDLMEALKSDGRFASWVP